MTLKHWEVVWLTRPTPTNHVKWRMESWDEMARWFKVTEAGFQSANEDGGCRVLPLLFCQSTVD